MADQNLPEENNLNQGTEEGTGANETFQQGSVLPPQEGNAVQEPASSFSEATTLPIDITSQEGEAYSPQAVPETPPPPPTIVLPAGGNGVPKWFYLIFGITLIVFFVVTALLINSLLQKPASSPAPATSSTPTPVVPSVLPSNTPPQKEFPPMLTPVSEATDQAVLKLRQRSSSDELVDLQSDIDNTDLSSIKEGLDMLDKGMGITPAPVPI